MLVRLISSSSGLERYDPIRRYLSKRSRKNSAILTKTSDLSKIKEKGILKQEGNTFRHNLKLGRALYITGSTKYRKALRLGVYCILTLGTTIFWRIYNRWEEAKVAQEIQARHWPKLEQLFRPFYLDVPQGEIRDITISQVEDLARDGFLWNSELGCDPHAKLLLMLYCEPNVSRKVRLYNELVQHLEHGFLTATSKRVRQFSEISGTEENKMKTRMDNDPIISFFESFRLYVSKFWENILGKQVFFQKQSHEMAEWSIFDRESKRSIGRHAWEFILNIRKYPGLLHYTLTLDPYILEELNHISQEINHAFLLSLIIERENLTQTVRSELYFLLKDGHGLVDYLTNPELDISDAIKILDENEVGEFKTQVTQNCRNVLKLYLEWELHKLKK